MITHIVFASCFFLSFFVGRERKNVSNILLIGVIIILFLFSSLRYDYGNDYMSYYRSFNQIKSGADVTFGKEFGFELLNKIMPSFFLLICIVDAVFLAAIYLLIKNNVNSRYVFISVFILLFNPYLFLLSLSAIRQTIAMCLFILAVQYSYKRKIIPYCLLIIVAAFFHFSAILLLPFYFFANDKKISNKLMIFIIVILVLLLLSSTLFEGIVNRLLSVLNDKNYNYYYKQQNTNSLRSTLLFGLILVYLIINHNLLNGKCRMYTKLYIVGVICGILAYKIQMISRIEQYFDIFAVASIPMIIKENVEKDKLSSQKSFLRFLNVWVLPMSVLLIFGLRYISFFNASVWEKFHEYHWVFDAF